MKIMISANYPAEPRQAISPQYANLIIEIIKVKIKKYFHALSKQYDWLMK
jgi:hypothetical protein